MRLFRSSGNSDLRAYFPGVRDARGWSLASPAVLSAVSSGRSGAARFSVPAFLAYGEDPKWLLFEGLGGAEYSVGCANGEVVVEAYDYVSCHGDPSRAAPFFSGTASYGDGSASVVPPATTFVLLGIRPSSFVGRGAEMSISPEPPSFVHEPHWYLDYSHRLEAQELLADGTVPRRLTLGELGRRVDPQPPPAATVLCPGAWISAAPLSAVPWPSSLREAKEALAGFAPAEALIGGCAVPSGSTVAGLSGDLLGRMRFLVRSDSRRTGMSIGCTVGGQDGGVYFLEVNGADAKTRPFVLERGWNDVVLHFASEGAGLRVEIDLLDDRGAAEAIEPYAPNSAPVEDGAPGPLSEVALLEIDTSAAIAHFGSWSSVAEFVVPESGAEELIWRLDGGAPCLFVSGTGRLVLRAADGLDFDLCGISAGSHRAGVSVSSRVVSWRVDDADAGHLVTPAFAPGLSGCLDAASPASPRLFRGCLTTALLGRAFALL